MNPVNPRGSQETSQAFTSPSSGEGVALERLAWVAPPNIEEYADGHPFTIRDWGEVHLFEWNVRTDAVVTSAGFKSLFGLKPDGSLTYASLLERVHPEDRAELAAHHGRLVNEGGAFEHEYRIFSGGKPLWFLTRGRALLNKAGRPCGIAGVHLDITKRKEMERALVERERWYRELLEALPAAIYATDAEGRITFYNQAAVELSGNRPQLGSDQWCVTWRLFWPDGKFLPHDQCPMAVSLKENRPIRGKEAVAERPDSTRVPFIPYPTPLRDEAGQLVGAVNMLVDISERKQAEMTQELLSRELSHRIKNIFAVVGGLVSMTARGDEAAQPFVRTFRERLGALATAHDYVRPHHPDSRPVAFEETLHGLLRLLLAPYRQAGRERFAIIGEDVPIGVSAASVLALVLHEQATNAAKYGALVNDTGQVKIGGERNSDVYTLTWEETGGPALSGPPNKPGFGTVIATRATGQLGGTIAFDWKSGGLTMRLTVPVEELRR
jgi:PAS domain S-box-containing protein